MIKPDAIFNKVTDISIDFLKKNHIKGVILDVDNTLLNLDEEMLPGAKEWVESLKDNNFKVCIASNSVKKSKLDKVSKELGIKYIVGSSQLESFSTENVQFERIYDELGMLIYKINY